MSETLISASDHIVDFIPQRHPIVMVDTLYSFDFEKVSAVSGLTVKANNMFCSDGCFSPSGLIEHIAQTAALMAGYRASKFAEHRAPKTGFIGAVRNFAQSRTVFVDSVLVTTLETLHQFDNVSIVKAKVVCDHETVAVAEMQIFAINE